MKKLLVSIIIVALWVSVAHADWAADFIASYETAGLELAVDKALQQGITPELIIATALSIDGVNPQTIIEALFLAGVDSEEITDAATKNKISSLVITAGLQQANGDLVAATQIYSPTGTPSGRFGRGDGSSGGSGGRFGRGEGGSNRHQTGRPFASPSGF